jgi:molecular chaperone GrpE (heat shock protein)
VGAHFVLHVGPMRAQMEPKLAKWPFFLGDGLLLGAAYFIYLQTNFPMGAWQLFFIVLCAGGGAMLCIMPFLLDYRLLLKLADAQTLTTATAQLENLEQLAAQIGAATGQWQTVQEHADKSAVQAKQISERISAEAKAFTEFLQRANDSEKATLRVEVDKLRRTEAEWLQVLVRIMDHVHALHAGAVRSGQPRVVEQVGHFQAACHDAARRLGLAPFTASAEEPFNPQRHQLAETDGKPAPDAVVGEVVATGYNFQGRLLRPVLVRVQENKAVQNVKPSAAKANTQQSQLPLEAAAAAAQ